jgi:mono/diheme cytochrome c family protein
MKHTGSPLRILIAPAVALGLVLASPVLPAEDLATSSGEQLFRRLCVSCHGAKADGNGPVAPFFRLKPPDLTGIAARHGGRFPLEKVRRIIDGTEAPAPHGAREMPVWGIELAMAAGSTPEALSRSQAAIGRLVDYVRTLQR